MKGLKIIYEPKGKALEYAGLALNVYNGCTHGCRYCFNTRYKKEAFFIGADPKAEVLQKVEHDASKLADIEVKTAHHQPWVCPEILISFVGDPYQPAELDLKLTRNVIKILIQHNLPFTILTKGGTNACRDFDLLEGYPRCSFGITQVLIEAVDCFHWEPSSAVWSNRLDSLVEAKKRGIRTWVSLEPVLDPEQALRIIRGHSFIVDHWKVGKINWSPGMPEELKIIERQTDWIKFRDDVIKQFMKMGITDYYLKKSLTDL